MRLNIKDIAKIIDLENIGYSEKQYWIELYFNKLRAYKTSDQMSALINILKNKCYYLENEKYYLYYCIESDLFTFETDQYYNDCNELISRNRYYNNYFRCSDCDCVSSLDYQNYIDSDGINVCESCYGGNYTFCESCEYTHHEEQNCNCNNHDEEETEEDNLKRWNYIIALLNLGYMALRYGIEIEVETREYNRYEIVEEIKETMNIDNKEYVVCKRDGSLDSERGFEIVSTNADFYYHKNIFWEEFFQLNLHESCKGYHGSNCGMHIHINRNSFSDFQQRVLNLFYHSPINKQFIVDIAGREDKQYAKFISYTSYHDTIDPHRDDTDDQGNGYRFRAFNLCNDDTFEIRIFRSNLKKISFYKNLEFVDSVNQWILSEFKSQDDFVKNSDLSDIDYIIKEKIHYHNYLDWLIKNVNKDYSNLYFYLDKKEIFNHLEYFEDFKNQYITFKTIVENFTNSESEFINQESEND